MLEYLYLYPYLEDNIGYVLHEPSTQTLIAVDTGDYKQSNKIICELERRTGATLGYILSTHKHWDHIDGNLEWKQDRAESL